MKCSLLTLSCALDGELSKERQVELEAHLVTCERCRTGMQYLREETERISQLAKVHIPSATATALLERARVVAPESAPAGSATVAASASETQILEVPPAAEPAAEADQGSPPAIPDPALWSTTTALPSFEGPTPGEALVEEEDQPLEEGEDPTSEATLPVAGVAEPSPPVAASPEGAAALEAEIEPHDAPDGSDQPPADLGTPEEIFPMGHAEAPEPDIDPAGADPEFVDLAPSLPAPEELGAADGYPSAGDPANSSTEDLWAFPAGAVADAPEERDQEGESDQGEPAGDQTTQEQPASSAPDNPWTAAEAESEPPSISPLGPWQRSSDTQRQLPAWVPLSAADSRPVSEERVPEEVPEPSEAGDRDELMQVALEESASLREDNPRGAAADEPTKAP
ncbi:MAG: zf-HC2 domain-containing protein, partial [Candidatus Dormiibacterota bacterium]